MPRTAVRRATVVSVNDEPRSHEERITALEREIPSIREVAEDARNHSAAARALASGTDRDINHVRASLKANHDVLHALRATQLEQAQQIRTLRDDMDRRFDRMDMKFDHVDMRFAHVDAELALVKSGIQAITALLTEHLDKS
jgi:chromosome segregation ATPase